MKKKMIVTCDDHWLVSRAVEVNRDDIALLLADSAWEASGDVAFFALLRIAKQAGLGCYW